MRKGGNPPDSCCTGPILPAGKEEPAWGSQPQQLLLSTSSSVLFLMELLGFVAHSSIFLQAVFRAELFCSTGWSFFAYLIVFNCEAGRTGDVWVLLQLRAPLMENVFPHWCEESLGPPALPVCAARNGPTRPGVALGPWLPMSIPTCKGLKESLGVKVGSGFTST